MAPMATTETAAPTENTPGKGNPPQEPSIPLISLAPLLEPPPSAPRTATAHALLSAFRHHGFLYLTTYADLIPPTLLSRVFAQSARFFALPRARKDALAWTTPRANRGYTRMGREKTTDCTTAAEVEAQRAGEGEDLKESFEIGREGEGDGCENRWVVDDDDDDDDEDEDEDDQGGEGEEGKGLVAQEFKETMMEFHERCKEVHRVLMGGIAVGMGLEEGFFDGFTRRGDNTLRLLHYPPVAAGGFEGGKRVRAGAHTDYGSITLLFQDSRGGLQVEPPAGEEQRGPWKDVEPRPGTIVVNAGDLLSRWSNDLVRSTRHRVVEPPGKAGEGHPARYSIAYFCNPDFDGWIEALPGTWEENGKKYEGVNSGDYLEQRLSATY